MHVYTKKIQNKEVMQLSFYFFKFNIITIQFNNVDSKIFLESRQKLMSAGHNYYRHLKKTRNEPKKIISKEYY